MSESTEKRYLKWYNKIGYGSGDIAGNVVYAFLSSFVMIYLTNTVGLDPGIVGTLIAVSKLLDGVTDVFFGSLIDKPIPNSARPAPGCCTAILAALLRWLPFCHSGKPGSVCPVRLVPDCLHPAERCVLHR